jgi:hypothetical protein
MAVAFRPIFFTPLEFGTKGREPKKRARAPLLSRVSHFGVPITDGSIQQKPLRFHFFPSANGFLPVQLPVNNLAGSPKDAMTRTFV